jgi:hypothetical protein
MCGFEFVIPLCRHVRIADQHQRWLVTKSDRLPFECDLVLRQKHFGEQTKDELSKRKPGETIPGGALIDAASWSVVGVTVRRVRVDLPSMEGRFYPFAAKPSERQRHAAMWTKIPHRDNLVLSITTQEYRKPAHEKRMQRPRPQLAARLGWIPKAEERTPFRGLTQVMVSVFIYEEGSA